MKVLRTDIDRQLNSDLIGEIGVEPCSFCSGSGEMDRIYHPGKCPNNKSEQRDVSTRSQAKEIFRGAPSGSTEESFKINSEESG